MNVMIISVGRAAARLFYGRPICHLDCGTSASRRVRAAAVIKHQKKKRFIEIGQYTSRRFPPTPLRRVLAAKSQCRRLSEKRKEEKWLIDVTRLVAATQWKGPFIIFLADGDARPVRFYILLLQLQLLLDR